MHCQIRPTPSALRTLSVQRCNHLRVVSARTLGTCIARLDYETRDNAATVATSQPLAALPASGSSGNDPNTRGTHGPKLLPRPYRPSGSNTSSKKSRSGFDGGGSSGGGGRGPGGFSERTIATLAAYTGLVGTTALVLGKLVGVDLWSEFDWASVDDLRLAAAASVPLQLLNAALLLPNYSSPKQLPDLGNLHNLEANLKEELRRREEAKAAAAASQATTTEAMPASAPPVVATAAGEDTSAAAVTTAASTAAAPTEPTASSSMPPPPVSCAPEAAPQAPPGLVPAASWGRSTEGFSKRGKQHEDGWTALRGALHLAQGYYVSNNPTARLTPAAETAYTLLDAAAGEMLYRGVALTWLASWLQDRVYEAGVDEAVSYQLPAVAQALGLAAVRDAVTALGVYGTCQCAVAAAVATFVVWSVTARSRRAAQRLEMIISVAAPSSPLSSSSSSPDSTRSAGRRRMNAAGGKGAAAGGGAANDGARAAAQVLFGPGGPSVGSSNAATVMRRAASIQATRDAAQILVLNGIFIASGGNLAASYSAAVLNQVLISAMQRRGIRRLRERSAALAKELKAYNAQMQRIANKYKDKLPPTAAARLDGMSSEDAELGPDTSAPMAPGGNGGTRTEQASMSSSIASSTSSSAGAPSNGSDEGAPSLPESRVSMSESVSSLGATGTTTTTTTSSNAVHRGLDALPASDALSAAAAAAAADASTSAGITRVPAPLSAAVDGGIGTRDSGCSSGNSSSSSGSSNLARALTMLDRLVPEPPKPASSDSKRSQRQPASSPPQPLQPPSQAQ